jgi:hypothetical protein
VKVSIIVNCDTRPQNDEIGAMFNGTVNSDYLIDGVLNKIKFFDGFEKEVIVCVDEHELVPPEVLEHLQAITDVLLIRKHTGEINFNEWNYWRAFAMATGDIVCHCDQDTACFTSGKEYVDELISHLGKYKFVSYPSHWTPNPVEDSSFSNMWWASTRFFICKREALKLEELAMCINDPEWMYEKYGDSPRKCNWTEHFLNKINGNSCLYPPVELHKGAIFSWAKYKTGTLKQLNNFPYELVKQWVLHRGGIQYPVDVRCD